MFETKDLDLSHVTTLHLTLVESGAFYVDKLYGDEKTLSKVMELLKRTEAKDLEEKNAAEKMPDKEAPHIPDYSRCIGSGDRYDKKALEILAESYNTFNYEKYLKHI